MDWARLRERRVVVAALSCALALVVLVFAAERVVRSLVVARARARGLDVTIDSVSFGFGTVRLRRLAVLVPTLPGFRATFGAVDVAPSFTLSAREIRVQGGSVRIEGSPEELERRFAELAPERRAGTAGASANGPAIDARGIDLVWLRDPGGRGEASSPRDARAWGARYERARDGAETVSADLARVDGRALDVDVVGGRVEFARVSGKRTLTGVSAASLVLRADLDALFTGDSPGAPISRREPRPALPEAAARRRDPRAELHSLAERLASVLPAVGKVELSGAHFVAQRGSETVNVGAATVVAMREGASVRISVTSGAAEGSTPLAIDVTLPTGDGAMDASVSGGPLRLSTLGVRDGDFGLRDVSHAEVRVQGRARLAADGNAITLSGQAGIDGLSLFQEKLARDPIENLRLSAGGDADLAIDGSRAEVRALSLTVGKATLRAHGTLERGDGDARLALHLEVPLAACEDLLAGAPRALVPLFPGLTLGGTFTLAGDVAFDTRRPAETRVSFDGANGCRVTAIPETLSPDRFRRPFQRAVLTADGREAIVDSGPGTADWVPLYDVSSFVPTAVVVCEDAHFFTHDGFDGKSLEDSIRDDLRAGRFVRGGSTVSMQLAKNLYLAREKTLSRKLQEAVLTVLLEQTLGKEAILELYLNVVEFGPGLYGIGPAARHYFGVTPKELSLGQALYLVSLLPNPKVHHLQPDGTVTEAWMDYLRHLMDIAHKIHRVTDAELAEAREEVVRFGVAAEHPHDEPDAEGSASPEVLGMEPAFGP